MERMFQTLQLRLPVEFRLRAITAIHEANEFLNSCTKESNAQLTLAYDDGIKAVSELQLSEEKINLTLAVLTKRMVDSGYCIQFQKKYNQMRAAKQLFTSRICAQPARRAFYSIGSLKNFPIE